MKSLTACTSSGFALIEIIVVIAVTTGLFAIGSFVDTNMTSRRSLSSEQAILVLVLQKARNQAMNNIYASPHGIHIEDDSYVIFREFPYHESNLTNETIPRNNNFDDGDDFEVIFTQLSGEPNHTGQINFNGGKYIKIEKSGLIDW